MNYLLFNPLSDNNHGEEDARKALEGLEEEYRGAELVSTLDLNYDEFFAKLNAEDKVILFGGDGTINYFVNKVYGKNLPCNFYLHRAGTGNDFATDNADSFEGNLLPFNKYLEFLPTVTVNGKNYHFVNGVGFGIDGQCCEVAEEMKKAGAKKIDYTSITIKLLLFKYKRPTATVIVDGKEYTFKKAYLASAMFGRYYGGGMMVAPEQNRFEKQLTLTVMSGKGRLKTLMVFPSIFKGEHVKHTELTTILTGKTVTVKFNIPTALQIDGEVISGVTEYTATVE